MDYGFSYTTHFNGIQLLVIHCMKTKKFSKIHWDYEYFLFCKVIVYALCVTKLKGFSIFGNVVKVMFFFFFLIKSLL